MDQQIRHQNASRPSKVIAVIPSVFITNDGIRKRQVCGPSPPGGAGPLAARRLPHKEAQQPKKIPGGAWEKRNASPPLEHDFATEHADRADGMAR